jgi:hypothetical protein
LKHSIFLAQFKIRGIQYDNNKNKKRNVSFTNLYPRGSQIITWNGVKKVIEKRFKLRSEAKKYELDMLNKIDKILSGERLSDLKQMAIFSFQIFSITFGGNLTKQGRQPVQLNRLQKLQ